MAVPLGEVLEVWTGTTPSGFAGGNSCLDWQNGSPQIGYGVVGLTDVTDGRWSDAYDQFCDRTDVHLYCFEQ